MSDHNEVTLTDAVVYSQVKVKVIKSKLIYIFILIIHIHSPWDETLNRGPLALLLRLNLNLSVGFVQCYCNFHFFSYLANYYNHGHYTWYQGKKQ